MSYDRDEYMRQQDAEHAMIGMRDPAPPSPMRLINGVPAWQVAVNEAEYRAAAAEMRTGAADDLLSVMLDLFENPQFQVAIGGNPIMVDALMDRARTAISRATGQVQS
jgi:hypothetical protein